MNELSLTGTLVDRYYPHFTDGEGEADRLKWLVHFHMAKSKGIRNSTDISRRLCSHIFGVCTLTSFNSLKYHYTKRKEWFGCYRFQALFEPCHQYSRYSSVFWARDLVFSLLTLLCYQKAPTKSSHYRFQYRDFSENKAVYKCSEEKSFLNFKKTEGTKVTAREVSKPQLSNLLRGAQPPPGSYFSQGRYKPVACTSCRDLV